MKKKWYVFIFYKNNVNTVQPTSRVSFVSKCLLAESAPKERSRFAHGSDSKLVQNGPHGPKALTVRSRFDIQNWSKMVLMGQKRSRFAHGNVQNDYRRTFALKMVVSRKIMVSRKKSLTLRSR